MIFVDSSAFVAAFSATDANHPAARTTFARLSRARDQLLTTNLVVVETASLLQRRLGFEAAARFVGVFLKPIATHVVGSALFDVAIDEWTKAKRRRLSLVDCTSFAFMRQGRIERAFAFDRDFSAAGFTIVNVVT